MKQDHRPYSGKSFEGGANTDMEPRRVAQNPGTYNDAQNMRPSDNFGGSGGSLVKIGGETLLYPADQPGAETYKCTGTAFVKGNDFEVWASTQPDLYDPLIRINGITMVKSSQLPYTADKKLQLHEAWECAGGMVFDARSGAIPLHWDIADIIRAYEAGEQTYFTGLDITAYQVNPTRAINRPVLLGLTNVGQGAGVVPGQRYYYIRFVNDSGDRTPDGPPLGPVHIPVTITTGQQTQQAPVYPHGGTAGADIPDLGLPTGFGVRLRFRSHNRANFQSVEVVCSHYSTNAGLNATPVIDIVYRGPVAPGENRLIDITDDGTIIEEIAIEEDAIQVYYIKEANSVRYINYRVAYGGVVLGPRDIRAQFIGDPGNRIVPITKNLGRAGHADVVNNCYYRRFIGGERNGIGVVHVDVIGGHSYVDVVEESVQWPNRRDEKAADSLNNSDQPCYAANVNNVVTPTFEAFDHAAATGRTQTGQVFNVMREGIRKIGTALTQQQATVPTGLSPAEEFPPYGFNNDGVFTTVALDGSNYVKTDYLKPFRPTNILDYRFGLDYLVNTQVHPSGEPNSSAGVAYDPEVFNVRHHSLGGALRGIAEQPDGVQGFMIVGTPDAGRVVMQCIAKWALDGGTEPPGFGAGTQPNKSLYRLHLCAPDFNAGVVNQEDWERIISNPSAYSMQMVSPVGIATDQFGSVMARKTAGGVGVYSALADLLTIARVQWDNGQVNPGNAEGISPLTPLPTGQDNFVGFGQYRNNPWSSAWSGANNGNRELSIASAYEVINNGSRSMVVTMNEQIYNTASCGSRAFGSEATKAFHEPWYVVNIVQNGAQPSVQSGFVGLNHYQMWKSEIGNTNGLPGQTFDLADENNDDIFTSVDGQERYIHILTSDGVQRWLFIGGFYGQSADIILAIQANGFWTTPSGVNIYGLYDVEFLGNVFNPFERRIRLITAQPVAGLKVEVRYNNTVLNKFYGRAISTPAIGTVVDQYGTANPPTEINVGDSLDASSPQSPLYPQYNTGWFDAPSRIKTCGLPIPFANYEYNGRYFVPFGNGYGVNGHDPEGNRTPAINQHRNGMIVSVRQWKVLFDCEVRAPLYLNAYVSGTGDRCFPNLNYVPRPYNFQPNTDAYANGTHNNYQPTYPGQNFSFGGFMTKNQVFQAYSLLPSPSFFKKPEFAFAEEARQCAALIWSEKKGPLQQDLPALKTFPVNNIEFIENDTGGIQRLFSTGGNLFVITEGGVFEVYIEKGISYSPDGATVNVFGVDRFVGAVLPRSKNDGMPGSTWQSAAEGAPFLSGRTKVDALMWWDGNTVQVLAGSQISDIAKGRYRKGIRDLAQSGLAGFVSGMYDEDSDELYIAFPSGVAVFSTSPDGSVWNGRYTYQFDNYLMSDERILGMRGLETYLLNEGTDIRQRPVEAWVKVPSAPYPGERMEWMRIRVDSNRKPSRIEFYNEDDQLVSWMDEPTFGPNWIKKEAQWEHWVPTNNVSVDPGKKRLQGTLAYYKVIYGQAGEDKVAMTSVLVKPLK